jgi:protocatechuate 3,4-dioxygenase beta subunit
MQPWRGWRTTAIGAVLSMFLLGTGSQAQAPAASTAPPAGQSAPSSGATVAREETCRVSGMVVKLADGTPLKNAMVQLDTDANREHTIATKTGADGRFALKSVPAGRYKLVVTRNGYVRAEYGQKQPSDPGAAFTLTAGENRQDLLFKLIPAAVIAGRVFDEDGEPVEHAVVMASRQVYNEGRRTLSTHGWAETDDLGQFRLFGLAPGRYFLSAAEPGWGQVNGDREFNASSKQEGERAYAKTYFPGTTDPTRATVISVKEGEEVPGMDIALKEVTVYRIRGKVFNQITRKAGKEVQVQLVPRGKRLEFDFGGGAEVKKSDGSFEIANVVPGSYVLNAYWYDEGKTYAAQTNVDIADSDVEGVALSIGAGATILGRVRWEGKPSLEGDDLQIFLQPETMRYWAAGNSARVQANQQFTLKDVNEGEFRVGASGLSKDCYFQEIQYGDTRSKDDTITVSKGGGAPLEITISSRGARVQGAVANQDGLPAAGVWVVAVPDEARRSTSRLFKSQTTDQYGKYDLHGIAPGSYRIFAWAGIEQGQWEDAEFLRAQEDKAESVELREDEVKTVNPKLIEKKSEATQ